MNAISEQIGLQDPQRMGRQIAMVRIALGVVLLAAPSGATRWFLRAPTASPETVTALRMAGGRDLAMGLGALLGARRRPESMRGWLEVGSVVEALDAFAYTTDRGFRPLARAAAVVAAAATAGLEMALARRMD